MKKVFFGLIMFSALLSSPMLGFGQASVDPGNNPYKWKQLTCPSTGESYEICWLTGDGNECSTWGSTTRSCPGS